MNDPSRFVGRSAKLCSAGEGTELKRLHVQICLYSPGEQLYDVQTVDGRTLRVPLVQLEFYTARDFSDCFPDAAVVNGRQNMKEFPVGAVIDFTHSDVSRPWNIVPSDLSDMHPTTITKSCRLVGSADNKMKLHRHIVIDCPDESDVVQFENMSFEPELAHKHCVECTRGSIVFLGCVFGTNAVAVMLGSDAIEHADVTFENCVFRSHKECALLIQSGKATVVNCVFNDCGMGAVVKGTSELSITKCHVENCIAGVVVPRGGVVSVVMCKFGAMTDFAVLVSNGSTVSMENCFIDKCNGDGVVVEGGYDTVANIVQCQFERCRLGVRIGNGRVSVNIANSRIRFCKFNVYIALDTLGAVTIRGCSYYPREYENIILSGDKCSVDLDGRGQATGTQAARFVETQPLLEAAGIRYGYPVSSMGMRALVEFGATHYSCAQCNTHTTSAYKRCARCRDARYCSKKCQREDWQRHKVDCQVTRVRSAFLAKFGYVSCRSCGLVESQLQKETHCACSGCLMVFYCSKQCQKNGWRVHKERCVSCSFVL